MRNRIIATLLFFCLGQAPGWALSFPDVKYSYGYPGYYEGETEKAGTLHTEQDGVTYEGSKGQKFHIPYHSIREQSYESQTRTNHITGFAFAGPNPIAMATTLGASVVGNMFSMAHPMKVSEHFYKIHYQAPDNAMREVIFRVPSENAQHALMDEVDRASREEYHNVLMLREEQMSAAPPPTGYGPPEPLEETANQLSPIPQAP